jgi:hypothetical protein
MNVKYSSPIRKERLNTKKERGLFLRDTIACSIVRVSSVCETIFLDLI